METEQVGKRTFSITILSLFLLSVNNSEEGDNHGENAVGGFVCLCISA
jgi:hypothetical protein